MIVNLKEMLADAREKRYAVPAFDVGNYEMIRAVIEVCEEERSPALFMGLKADLAGNGIRFLTAMMRVAAERYSVPVCIHLDHASDLDEIKTAIANGFSSVMYDGSMLPFSENVERTREAVDYAHAYGVSVEAELGHVGNAIAGTESKVFDNGQAAGRLSGEDGADAGLTAPEEVRLFVKRTQVDALAVAIGTSHGVYRSTPRLRFDRLKQITDASDVPLVLHGGSGTPDEQIVRAIELGITKINIYSEVLNALNTGLREKLNEIENMSMWPVYVYEKANERMREVIRRKIRLFGSAGKA